MNCRERLSICWGKRRRRKRQSVERKLRKSGEKDETCPCPVVCTERWQEGSGVQDQVRVRD